MTQVELENILRLRGVYCEAVYQLEATLKTVTRMEQEAEAALKQAELSPASGDKSRSQERMKTP